MTEEEIGLLDLAGHRLDRDLPQIRLGVCTASALSSNVLARDLPCTALPCCRSRAAIFRLDAADWVNIVSSSPSSPLLSMSSSTRALFFPFPFAVPFSISRSLCSSSESAPVVGGGRSPGAARGGGAISMSEEGSDCRTVEDVGARPFEGPAMLACHSTRRARSDA